MKTRVELEIEYDPTGSAPQHWDWAELLDLPDREDVKVLSRWPDAEPWPDLAVVNVERIKQDDHGPLSSLWRAMELGQTIEAADRVRLTTETMPPEVRRMFTGHVNPTLYWRRYDKPPSGQIGRGTPNIYLILEPRFWGYRDGKAEVLRVELGCDHDYKSETLGRCWYRSTCQKCGYQFEVDSSD